MTYTPARQNGKSVALAACAAAQGRILIVNRAQFEAFRKHGIPADQMRIAEDVPKSTSQRRYPSDD